VGVLWRKAKKATLLASHALEITAGTELRWCPIDRVQHTLDAHYTTRENGTGLGLAIVQQVFQAHQGQVRIENCPQGGTRVVLTLPLHPKETPAWWNKQRKRFPA
jgi:sensor histidine kinase regulating citrate/malate metabolism